MPWPLRKRPAGVRSASIRQRVRKSRLPVFIVTVDGGDEAQKAFAHRRTPIMRAIKCLKSIWWMPWR